MHQLSNEDWGFLDTNEMLTRYLLDIPAGGHPCGRLMHYKNLARIISEMFKEVDDLATPSPNYNLVKPLSEDFEYKVERLSELIRKRDRELDSMLSAQNLLYKKDEVCRLYALIVMGHGRNGDLTILIKNMEGTKAMEKRQLSP